MYLKLSKGVLTRALPDFIDSTVANVIVVIIEQASNPTFSSLWTITPVLSVRDSVKTGQHVRQPHVCNTITIASLISSFI